MDPTAFLFIIVLVTSAEHARSNMAMANVTTTLSDTADINPTTMAEEMTEETVITAPPPSPSSTKPKRKEAPQGDRLWPHGREGHRDSRPGHCLYYSEPLKCFAKIESRGLNWLKLAAEYNSSFETDFPDTCRYTSDMFRCMIPLSGHLATILRAMSHYNLNYRIKLSDRRPYGLHLDVITGLNDIVNLLDLFSVKTALVFQQNVWNLESAIYDELQKGVPDLPRIQYEQRDLRHSFYAFFARICNQLDTRNPILRLLPVYPLEKRHPLSSLDAYLDNAYTRRVHSEQTRTFHEDVKRDLECRSRGKRAIDDVPVPNDVQPKNAEHVYTNEAKQKDTGHIYTDPLSEPEYLEPESLHGAASLPVRGPPPWIPATEHPSSKNSATRIPTAQEARPTRDFFTQFLIGKKHLGTV